MDNWFNSGLVIFGGAVGSWLRFAISHYAKVYKLSEDFPWHTFGINVAGSFLIGLFGSWFYEKNVSLYCLFGVGFCGGFTTFSTFSLETIKLMHDGRYLEALTYVVASVVSGVSGVALALWLARN